MERSERPPARRGRNNPSFSSSLLDSIYRSIDETDGDRANSERYKRTANPVHQAHSRSSTTKSTAPVTDKAVTRRKHQSVDHRRFFFSTSSSSECSSYGGFSSSDAESTNYSARPTRIRAGPVLARLDRLRSEQPPPPQRREEEKKKTASIRSRFRDLRKARDPASPGARLAGFLNSLFTAAGNPKKAKIATPTAATVDGGGEESTCSSASSYSRSCLSKTTQSSRGRPAAAEGPKRSVRFCPVSVIVDKDCRPCGQKHLFDGDLSVRARDSKKMVEELLKGFDFDDEEDDDDDGESDSSSDLFELENLSAIGRYRNELPVYETTHFGSNRPISQGLIL